MLEVQGLTCFRQSRCLFADLSFTLQSGAICQIEGPNGVGKSTLLRAIMGLFRADEGTIYWHGNNVQKEPEQFFYETLYLGHKLAIHSDLTAKQNIEHWASIHPANQTSIEKALEIVGLYGLEDIYCHSMSAGQHRKVALARLWMTSAKLWILDEPFTAIDKRGVALLQQKFAEHIAEGGIIIITTHQDLSYQFASLQTINLKPVEDEEW